MENSFNPLSANPTKKHSETDWKNTLQIKNLKNTKIIKNIIKITYNPFYTFVLHVSTFLQKISIFDKMVPLLKAVVWEPY